MTAALAIEGLRVEYKLADGSIVTAVDDVSLGVAAGEIHALVGESGAGKSTVGSALMGLLQAPGRITAGTIAIAGRHVDLRSGRADGIVQGRDIGAIFQDPMTSLNPLFTIERQLCEAMRHHLGLDRRRARARALELMRAVGIHEPERRLRSYPHQLSGGQLQRVVIACALSCDPKLIVADEPTTALDVSVQAQILRLIRSLADQRGVGVLLVTHNMGVVAEVADTVTIMQRGAVVETGPVAMVLGAPRHPYARTLIGAVPRIDTRMHRLPVPSEEAPAPKAAREKLRLHPRAAPVVTTDKLLVVDHLVVEYRSSSWLGGRGRAVFRAVDDVSFTVGDGEIFGIVGESGCGKTTLANTIAGLVKPSGGTVRLRGPAAGGKGARRILQMVFQDPYSALNPRLKVTAAVAEPVLFYQLASTQREADEDAALLLEAVGLDRSLGRRFPHAFSGGQRQRIAIARALAARPTLLLCDEPTSSLDVSVQAQLLNLLKDLRDITGLAMIFISHDLAVVRQMCDRVAVMKSGAIVELADTETLFAAPLHPYTRELLSLVPTLDKIARAELETVP
jgi:peptide/nickel transport system ATP-binding protein